MRGSGRCRGMLSSIFLFWVAGCVQTNAPPLEDSPATSSPTITEPPTTTPESGTSSPAVTPNPTHTPEVETSSPVATSSPTLPPGDDDISLPPGDDDISLPPGDDDVSLPPGDDDVSLPPGDDDSPLGDDDTDLPPAPPAVWIQGAVLLSETPLARMSLVRLSDAAEVWYYNIYDRNPYLCAPGNPCNLFRAWHSTPTGVDSVDFVFSTAYQLGSVVQRVPMANQSKPTFTVWGLDFSAVPEAGCSLPPEQSCQRTYGDLDCLYRFAHDFSLLEDVPEQGLVSMVIADTENLRLLGVELDYAQGGECGKVEWVLPMSNVLEGGFCPPNAVQVLHEDGQRYLLVTCRSSETSPFGGRLVLVKETAPGSGQWARAWLYPDPTVPSDSWPLLNLPHGGVLEKQEDESFLLHYAHADGLGTDWGEDDRGTLARAWLPTLESQPDYLFDEGVDIRSAMPAMSFLRGVTTLPDGHRMAVDSGSFAVAPIRPSRLWIFDSATAHNDSRLGTYTPAHEKQNLVEARPLLETELDCGWSGLFGAAWIDPAQLTPFMRGVLAQPGLGCGGRILRGLKEGLTERE